MSDRDPEKNELDSAVDPPENQPGGGAMSMDRIEESDAAVAVDPPENQPGGGGRVG